MADKLGEAEKKRDKAQKDFDDAQGALDKAVKKYQTEKSADKQVPLLRHVHTKAREAIEAGDAYLSAQEAFEKAEKAAG